MNPILKELLNTGEAIARDGTRVRVHSNIGMDEASFITELVKETRPKFSLEVGLAYGISALAILDGADQSIFQKHICIDPSQNGQPGWGGIGLYNLERAGFSRFVEFHEARSYEALPRILARGESVDFAFMVHPGSVYQIHRNGV